MFRHHHQNSREKGTRKGRTHHGSNRPLPYVPIRPRMVHRRASALLHQPAHQRSAGRASRYRRRARMDGDICIPEQIRIARLTPIPSWKVQGNMHKGAFAGPVEGWSGPRGVNSPFLIAAVKVDTDAAYKTALGKGRRLRKEKPRQAHHVHARKDHQAPRSCLARLVGRSVQSSNFSVLVDASTGAYLETMH